jgi:hypothetical protein
MPNDYPACYEGSTSQAYGDGNSEDPNKGS